MFELREYAKKEGLNVVREFVENKICNRNFFTNDVGILCHTRSLPLSTVAVIAIWKY
jgi:hypothetical protein